MPWRNRYLAPVYALVIGFVLVALLGAAVGDRSSPSPNPTPGPTASGTIGFVPVAGDVKKLKNTKVEVFGDTKQTGTLDAKGKLNVGIPATAFTVCATLPDGWTALQGKPTESPGTCWGPFNPATDLLNGTLMLSVVGPQ